MGYCGLSQLPLGVTRDEIRRMSIVFFFFYGTQNNIILLYQITYQSLDPRTPSGSTVWVGGTQVPEPSHLGHTLAGSWSGSRVARI